MGRVGTHFTEFEDATVIRLKRQGTSDWQIGKVLGRTRSMIEHRVGQLRKAGRLEAGRHAGKAEPPSDALVEAARAYAAPRSITAAFCGDPLPGRSALDKRNRGP